MARSAENLLSALPDEKSESRLSARVPLRVKETIELAAELSGATATQFMAQAAYHAAQQLIEQERVVRLNHSETQRFLALLDNPPAPTEKLKLAVEAYKQSSLHVKN
ncbi:MAG: DUF1778 domain-containing protein [Ectothiorhodospiraceae bacterium]|nr:DUF1778 domain-containing protein [Ectothiorhodospiraceae bacterium]